MSVIPDSHFDRSKPYYPYVIHYVVGLWAMKELAGYGLGILARAGEADLTPAASEPNEDSARRVANHRLVELLPPLELTRKSGGAATGVDIAELAEEITRNHLYLFASTMRAAGGLLISAYEISKQHRDHGELWEFFRHVRNAAAHGGSFNFLGQQPTRAAQWRGIELTRALQGSPLFDGASQQSGLLGPGDPLSLLWDVEQTLPSG